MLCVLVNWDNRISLAQEIARTCDLNECSKQRLIKTQGQRLSDALIIMLIKCFKTTQDRMGTTQMKLVPCHVITIIFSNLPS